jgi:hypothetical protein
MRNLLFFFFFLTTLLLNGQVNERLDKNFSSDDSTALVSIANYPDSIRHNILLACQKPDLLVKTELLQKNSSRSFRSLIDNYSKESQQKFWNLSRYPKLINEIVTGNKKSKEELKTIASRYPEELRPVIVEYGEKHIGVLTEMNNLYEKSNIDYDKLIANNPINIKTAYLSLRSFPDVLNILTSNMHLAVILGNMYVSDSKYTLLMLDSIKIKQEAQRIKETEDWQKGLEKNPEAKKEMEQVTKEFIKDKQSDENVDDVYNNMTSNNSNPQIYTTDPVLNYAVQPYPYWFGYPWWYDYPYWYPYPYWYNSGFYWGPYGIVYIGLPSPYFMHWYFFHQNHHYYYSHFSDYCIGYQSVHYGPRIQRTGFNSEIIQWTKVNEHNLPKGYLNSDGNRQNRIKELGRFEMNYHNNTTGIFGKNITRSEFLQNNSSYYPHLNSVISQPHFDQRVIYPKQQGPVKFNMDQPNNYYNPSNRMRSNMPQQSFPKSSGGGNMRRR